MDGLEPSTCALQERCSLHLSYTCINYYIIIFLKSQNLILKFCLKFFSFVLRAFALFGFNSVSSSLKLQIFLQFFVILFKKSFVHTNSFVNGRGAENRTQSPWFRVTRANRYATPHYQPCLSKVSSVFPLCQERKLTQKEQMVPENGLEPSRSNLQGILSPRCLPFHHSGLWLVSYFFSTWPTS